MPEIRVEVRRSGRIESAHNCVVAVVEPDGHSVFEAGDVRLETYIRSAAKPVQALPLLESGAAKYFDLSARELAVIMASHNAEDFHLDAVRNILKKTDLAVEDLRCGFHRPINLEAADNWVLEKAESSAIFNNCSGKHAGMLTSCRFRDWPLESYLAPEHPLQIEILDNVARFTSLEPHQIARGMDGCSAPVFYLPIREMALIYARLAQGKLPYSDEAFKIMCQNPEMIAGTGRFDTDFMRVFNGRAISKVGAEGVRCVGIAGAHPLGIALKILDGNARASAVVMGVVLRHLNLISEDELTALKTYFHPIIVNCAGIEVGEIEAIGL